MATLYHVKVYVAGRCEDLLHLHNKTAQVPAFPAEYVFLTPDATPLMSDAAPYLIAGYGQGYLSESGAEVVSPLPDDVVTGKRPVLQFLTWEAQPRLLELLRKGFPKIRFSAEVAAMPLATE